MIKASKEMESYFESISCKINTELEIAKKARRQGFEPTDDVEITLAKNAAERVVGIISVIAPQIVNKGIEKRIVELENQYGALDWRVALQIGLEIAQEKFCKFKDQKEAMSVGIRTGFAYVTLGVVASPIEGIVSFDFKKRLDNQKEYVCINYAGPIRSAGGTAAAVSVIITDYIRKSFGYDVYDAQEIEIKRAMSEMQDHRDKIAPRQYFPSLAEHEFMMKNLPVEIGGEPTEKIEVSNYKDLPRIPTNLIRSGFCLMMVECLPLKAPKLWKQLSVWGKDFGLDHWNFLEQFLVIQKKAKAREETKQVEQKEKPKITPDYTYITDLVAGRPVLGFPLRKGGLRLRYGRTRTSGYSALAVHPATMIILDNFIAFATHVKVERPSKGGIITVCDMIEGPIVKLKDGSVCIFDTDKKAKQYKEEIAEILFLGDLLISYGDFFDRAHSLVPAGYCEEWWIQEFEKASVGIFGTIDAAKIAGLVEIDEEIIDNLLKQPFKAQIDAKQAIKISEKLKIPLHPHYTFHWKDISIDEFVLLFNWLKTGKVEMLDGMVVKIILGMDVCAKRVLELIGAEHLCVNNEFVVIEKKNAAVLMHILRNFSIDCSEFFKDPAVHDALDLINKISSIKIRDKSGTFIGARMGRPEKAKMRKLTGSPQVLFPIGEEGGRLRCFQSAFEKGKVTSDFPVYKCSKCNKNTIFRVCETCGKRTNQLFNCQICGLIDKPECNTHGKTQSYKKQMINISYYFNSALKKIGADIFPDLIKGVRGTSNKDHISEYIGKGILRAKHDLYVNKDGTIRVDASEAPITHFKPKEIDVSVEKLKQLGYTKDCYGRDLVDDSQVLEIKVQDIILPCCKMSGEEPSDEVLFRATKFIDESLERLYGLEPYYCLKSREGLVGQLIIGLAPHTSAGILGRIIGFSETQSFLAHPLMHAAMRRDCDGDEAGFFLALDAFINFSRKYLPNTRGATQDAPLVLTSQLIPAEVDDMVFNMDVAWKYPLELYEAAQDYKMPWDVKIRQIKQTLHTEQQYEGMGFTHDTENLNKCVLCSAYKILPSMEDKLRSQMGLAEKLRAVDPATVAKFVIDKHFLKDIKGNLRKFSQQQFRCVNCNAKYRRPPLTNVCSSCGGKVIFTISEGSIVKYLEPSISLAAKYDVDAYTKQTLELTKRMVEGVFGKEKEKQSGLGAWFTS